MSNNHERFEWFAIGFNVCLIASFLSYVALIHGEVCKPTEAQDQIRDIRKLLEDE